MIDQDIVVRTDRRTNTAANAVRDAHVDSLVKSIRSSVDAGDNTPGNGDFLSVLIQDVYGPFVLVTAEARQIGFNADDFIKAIAWLTGIIHYHVIAATSFDAESKLIVFERLRHMQAGATVDLMAANGTAPAPTTGPAH